MYSVGDIERLLGRVKNFGLDAPSEMLSANADELIAVCNGVGCEHEEHIASGAKKALCRVMAFAECSAAIHDWCYAHSDGTEDFEDMRENAPLGRKISRRVGELLGFIFPTAEGKLFEGGVKAATALGAKKTIGGAAAKFAAGGVAVSPTHLDVGSPVNPRNDVAGQLAANAVAEGASSAVFGAGLGAVGRGLSAAAHSPLTRSTRRAA